MRRGVWRVEKKRGQGKGGERGKGKWVRGAEEEGEE